MLSLISAQQSLLIFKDNQTERLSAELKRIEQTNPPYYVAVGVKVALKLISIAGTAGADIAEMLEKAVEETQANQKWEQMLHKSEMEERRLREAHRKVLSKVIAAGYMQAIHSQIAARATENLCQAHMYILGVENNSGCPGYLPPSDQMLASLSSLRDMTMSYAHDLAEYGESIDKQDRVLSTDGYEVSSQKEALHLIKDYAGELMQTAIGMVDTAYSSVSSMDTLEGDRKKGQTEWLAAFGIAASSLSKFVAQMVFEAQGSLGTVSITQRVTSNVISDSNVYTDLTALTQKKDNYRLN
jgi:hypothetical protein